MSSLNAILNTASNAVTAYQASISVTGQNIANADNDDYSIQSAQLSTTSTITSRGNIYGTGVTVSSVTSSVNQIIENALTSELSNQAALEEAKVYMSSIEDLFSEDSDDSLNTLLDAYWSTWEDLSNNPSGETEQNAVYDAGLALTKRINAIEEALSDLTDDLNSEMSSAVAEVNSISEKIAALNLAIRTAESSGGNANDLKDERNALVDDLGERIDIDIRIKEDGSYLILSSGLPLAEDGISYDLSMKQGSVYWTGKSGNTYDITDDISGGSIAGWLEVRDVVIPETQSEFDELATNLIWTLNYQHSQGAGQTYFSGSLEGTHEAGDSGTFASLYYGDEIDYTKDFSMVIQDATDTTSEYQTVTVDMAISTAEISNITGTGQDNSIYELTVIDEGTLGEQTVVQSSGSLLGGTSYSATGFGNALDGALAEQTLTITNGSDTQTIEISDRGDDAIRSASDIAEQLSNIDGITAYASTTSAYFDLSGISSADDGDAIEFTLYVDGLFEDFSFIVDSSEGTLEEQFEDALQAVAEAINKTNKNTDLAVDGTSIESVSGATIGIYEFNVVDNAGITLSNFQNFDTDGSVMFTLSTTGTTTQDINITVDLSGVDTSNSDAVAQAFYDAVSEALADNDSLTAQFDDSTGELTIFTTDGSSVSLSNGIGDAGSVASIDIAAAASSVLTGGGQFDFDGSDVEGATPTVFTGDTLNVSLDSSGSESQSLAETGSGATDAVAITGSVTIVMDPGMEISSDEKSAAGLFGTSGKSGSGTSMVTLGGPDGYEGFDDGGTISFEVDGNPISYTVSAPPGTTDEALAQQLYDALTDAATGLPTASYQVVKNGTSVTIVKIDENDDNAMEFSAFSDDTGDDAVLRVATGTGTGSEAPENDSLVANSSTQNATTAVTYGDAAVIYWEVLDENGHTTGDSGYLEVDETGLVEITENGKTTLSFEISEGSLVGGNTLRINTDDDGAADILLGSVTGKGASVDDTYEFTVISGGTLPDNEEVIVIEWTSETGSGTIKLEGNEKKDTQVSVEVDGMTLTFDRGTLVEGDVFYVTTDDDGKAVADADGNTLQTLSDWHWTLDSFADEFNRSAGGVTASVTKDHSIQFQTNDDYCAIENVTCSGSNNIDEENFEITVLNYSALEIEAEGLEFERKNGSWRIANDPTGGTMAIIPEGGDDDGFQIDLDGDGIGDIEITFDQSVSGDGYIRMDLESKDADDLSYAFAGDENGDSGVAAALGVNTFFTGTGASTIGVNDVVSDGDLLASGILNTETFELASSDNTNALAMAETRYDSLDMKEYTYTRGEGVTVTVTTTSLDDYQASLVSTVGSTASSLNAALEYSETLVYQLTEQRDSISAVSLDEEMINLTAQQQAYLAAAKLLTMVQEMFDAILATR
ncbi:flagellar hook-associated protein FlgK [uncultured Desulfobacter sp.]|uniref:flagellar hook-associated protein FlgK n=1 Tax=uncultured Desulfobacter sp. TaxID=240139 RepID=UPI002AABF234|nr:flagellar hook-associated protein FlgK [uncultured Desulfobacter sp.]